MTKPLCRPLSDFGLSASLHSVKRCNVKAKPSRHTEMGRALCNILREAGYECYMVGGAVRDMYMGVEPHDVDLATNAKPAEVMSLYRSRGYKAIPTGIDFGTITVIAPGGDEVEITTYRSEGRYIDYRRPSEVAWEADVTKDLSRRDFTINAIAYDPITSEVKDPFDGLCDIKNRSLRAVGDPYERFSEDPLRMMRFIRFVGRLGFKPDPGTVRAIRDLRQELAKISKERVRDELLETLRTRDATRAIRLAVSTGLMDYVIPGLSGLDGMEQNELWHRFDVLTHSLKTMENLPRNKPLLRLAGLIHDIRKPATDHASLGAEDAEQLARTLKMSTDDKGHLSDLVKHHMDLYSYTQGIGEREVRRYLNKVGESLIEDLLRLNEADVRAMGYPERVPPARDFAEALLAVKEKKQPFGRGDLAIKGGDVMDLGYRGAQIGFILGELTKEVIEDPSRNRRDYLLSRAGQLIDS